MTTVSQSNFGKAMALIDNNNNTLRNTAYREKRLSRMPIIYENENEYDVSEVSAVPHVS